ncbi:MAG TPA: hypothetical protein VF623_02785 [Segetibacter sp.]
MKYVLLLPVAVLCCIAAKAQKFELNKSGDEMKRKRFLSEKMNSLPIDTSSVLVYNKQRQYDPGVINIPMTGKYLGLTTNGDSLYAMSPDNMPCIVPGKTFKSNMPIAANDKIALEPFDKSKKVLPPPPKIIGRGDNFIW